MPSLTLDLIFSSLALAATSLSSRAVVWLPSEGRQRWLPWFQALAVGLLLGDAFQHVLPHALEGGGEVERALMVTGLGVVSLLLVEFAMRSTAGDLSPGLPVARVTLLGDFIHHAVDGMILAGAFAAGAAPGYAALVAIALHEVPREMSSAGVLVAMGYTPARAFMLSVAMAAAVPLAALGVMALSLDARASSLVSAFSAGTIIYVALADILPGVWARAAGRARIAPVLGALGGMLFMALLAQGEHHH
ncbi:ZIP family metal transporter [Luteibacter aegosomaticola]|uniref:ZIP family metal transporter n=1 Tax=Luteibacter aegosomaticola TaxID=2911538 RepID=UPI001FF78B7C|nr:ZIP family metal transporter [Luteibacter aegosomaticola]UPG88116.1 ZIP family metal transporter [Luteibacter aegosomaticola]